MQDRTPEICVIICTYNTKDLTCECLDKLKKSIEVLGKAVETIVVENGNDGTGAVIKKRYSWVKVLEPSENTGFAKGNNLGIKASNKSAKYYLFLNTDALIKPETLLKSIQFIENHPTCDVVGCRLRLGNGMVQSSGGYLPSPSSVWTWIWGIDLLPIINIWLKPFHQKNMNFFNSDREVGWVMGAYLFMKREVIKKTKGFDETFFMYMEEVEWCKRIRIAGFHIWYASSFEIIHLDKTSSKSDPEKFRKIAQKEVLGVIYFLKKYYSNQIYWVIPLIKIGLYLRVLAFGVLGNEMRKTGYLETIKAI